MICSHAERAESPLVPPMKEEVERCAAVAQADVLERRQLVETRGNDRAAGNVRAGLVPGRRR